MGQHEKIRAERWGRSAESLAVLLLRLKGYSVLHRRLRTPAGEIDIVAKRGRTLAIVEVKARADLRQAGEALSAHQRRRLTQAATWLIGAHSRFAQCAVRFDLVLVRRWRWPHHVIDAWRPDD